MRQAVRAAKAVARYRLAPPLIIWFSIASSGAFGSPEHASMAGIVAASAWAIPGLLAEGASAMRALRGLHESGAIGVVDDGPISRKKAAALAAWGASYIVAYAHTQDVFVSLTVISATALVSYPILRTVGGD